MHAVNRDGQDLLLEFVCGRETHVFLYSFVTEFIALLHEDKILTLVNLLATITV